jgi:hypothetical protein
LHILDLPLLHRCERRFFFAALCGFDLGGLFSTNSTRWSTMSASLEPMVGDAAQIDLVRAVGAAGETDIGLARLAKAVDDAADHRHGEWRRDVLEALFEPHGAFGKRLARPKSAIHFAWASTQGHPRDEEFVPDSSLEGRGFELPVPCDRAVSEQGWQLFCNAMLARISQRG